MLAIEYPDRPLDRMATFWRPVSILPILIVLGLISHPKWRFDPQHGAYLSGGSLFLATALMLLVRRKYPRWWFDWNVEITRFGTRVIAYASLLTDVYPSTDEEQAVHLMLRYPDAERDLDRWLPLLKWLLAVPHYLVLGVLTILAIMAVTVAWVTILISGQYPRALFAFVVGVIRWWIRVSAYAFLLITDRYPPFSLD
jgi:hypothetical protein